MHATILAHQVDWQTWRTAARTLALNHIPPDQTTWSVGAVDDLFADPTPPPAASGAFTLPKILVDLLQTLIQHSDPERFALMYSLVHRAHAGEKHLLEMTTDPQVHQAGRLAQSVRRDTHKMRAFVRFREVPDDGEGQPGAIRPESQRSKTLRHIAWFEPDHYIVEANAPFFVRRFATMTWSILTPYRSVHWTGEELEFTDGALKSDIPDDDHLEAYWRAYYSSIFNPARLKIGAMTSEMPKKYWRNLPEAAAIPELIRTAAARTDAMVDTPLFSPAKPARPPATQAAVAAPTPTPDPTLQPASLAQAATAIHACRRCALWEPATQPVFGEGPPDARIMFVGEQPGDQEDLAGRPFIGPAGQLFDRAMAEAGLDRATVYVTNAVKHFKFVPRGKRRIHEKPGTSEIVACRFWLDLERTEVAPALTVMLGATAARAVLGRTVTIGKERSRPIPLEGNRIGFVTVHPSYLLRLPDEDAKAREYAAFVQDLKSIKNLEG